MFFRFPTSPQWKNISYILWLNVHSVWALCLCFVLFCFTVDTPRCNISFLPMLIYSFWTRCFVFNLLLNFTLPHFTIDLLAIWKTRFYLKSHYTLSVQKRRTKVHRSTNNLQGLQKVIVKDFSWNIVPWNALLFEKTLK